MALDLFSTFKKIESVDGISKFNKFFVNGGEFLDLMNRGAIDGKNDVNKYETELPAIVERSIISFLITQVLDDDFLENDERYIKIKNKYESIENENIEGSENVEKEFKNYIISSAHEKLKNTRFVSVTRGDLETTGSLDAKVPRYIGTEIHYEMNGESKHFEFRSFIKTKNGWKITAW